jgi:hypothetical protein
VGGNLIEVEVIEVCIGEARKMPLDPRGIDLITELGELLWAGPHTRYCRSTGRSCVVGRAPAGIGVSANSR